MPQWSWGSGWYPAEEWPASKWPPYDREPTPWELKGSPPPPPDAVIPWWLDTSPHYARQVGECGLDG